MFQRLTFTWVLVGLLNLCLALPPIASEETGNGVAKRVPWTASRVQGSPEPPLPYVTERVFPNLKFNQCLDLATPPVGNRIFVAEQSGKIFSFPNQPDVESADLVIDFAKEIDGLKAVYALTFHPKFEQNRYCYVCYIMAPNLPDGTHISRFTVSDTNPPTIDAKSELPLITWLSGGHNGCCLKFGPDGYLYISTGDGSGPNPPDTLKAGQDLSNLLSSILRIDVDHPEAGRNYRIPSDNPFVHQAGARGEIYAYGFRNPWRMSFDAKTGDLWVGDVGWELWELLDRVEKGGNYGWSIMEGRQPTNPEWQRGPTPILPPTIDHPHSESSSITDGLTYYGSRIRELHGMHLYGDYDTGKFWGFRYRDGKVVDHRELADTTHRIVGFGEDREGEMVILDHAAGTLHRLVPNPVEDRHASFPRKISQSGIFESLRSFSSGPLSPAPGVLAYSIQSELWSDGAVAERWIGIPEEGSIQTDVTPWKFPKDSLLIKTLSWEQRMGDPTSRRRVETQLLHFDGLEWQPYTYRWNDEQTDADLVGPLGDERTLEVIDSQAPGGRRTQTWRFAGRAECQRCHNRWSGPPLGFNAPQLNHHLRESSGSQESQLKLFSDLGLFEKEPKSNGPFALVNPSDSTKDLGLRARSYLHANCGHCHRMHAGSSVLSKMHFDLPIEKTDMIGVRPTQGTFGIHGGQVIAAGDPFRSILFYRMAKLGGGRMPHIGSTEIDFQGLQLIEEWIQSLPVDSNDPDKKSSETIAKSRVSEKELLTRLASNSAPEAQDAILDQLFQSPTGALMLRRAFDRKSIPESLLRFSLKKVLQHPDVSTREMFEHYLPADQRIKRLGSVIRPEQILALSGDPVAGQKLFFDTAGISCKNCHQIDKKGIEIGPDLSAIGKKYTKNQILESILDPSKLIEPKYVTHLVETSDGQIVTGLLVRKSDQEIVLKDAQNKEIRLAMDQVEQLVAQRQSLMPEMLLREMTAQQVADLLAYLSSLRESP